MSCPGLSAPCARRGSFRGLLSGSGLPLLLLLGLGACAPGSLPLCGQNLALNRPDQAASCYQEALAHDPDSLPARRGLGRTLTLAGDWAGAEAALRQVLDCAPGDPEATLYLGLALAGAGNRKAGLDLLATYSRPFAFRESQVVQEAADRCRTHPEWDQATLVRTLEAARDQGRREQEILDRQSRFGGL